MTIGPGISPIFDGRVFALVKSYMVNECRLDIIHCFERFSVMTSRRDATPAGSKHGFTLVEIMVVVVIVGILAAIAIPIFNHLRRNAQNNRFISDVRTFAQAYETYAMKNGQWPPAAADGAVPTGMSGELRDDNWSAVNSLGGRWNWDYRTNGVTAGISVTGASADDAQMAEIDQKIDDGNLSSGNLIKTNNRLIYILQR